MENETIDNAVAEEVVALQEPEATEAPESEETEVAPVADVEETKEQSAEDNHKFKELRVKHEQEKQSAVDKVYSDMYGESHNIHTKADYDKAIAEQEKAQLFESLKDGEVDPEEAYQKLKENDPEFQSFKQSQQQIFVDSQLAELNSDLKGLELDITINSLDDISKLPNSDDVIKYIEKGNTLSDAYFLANKADIIKKQTESIQQKTIERIQANGGASPGALSDTGETASLFTEAQVDAMSQAEVNKNYDLIMKSMKSW